MNLVYNIQDKPKFPQLLILTQQQVLAILSTIIACALILGILTNILVSRTAEE